MKLSNTFKLVAVFAGCISINHVHAMWNFGSKNRVLDGLRAFTTDYKNIVNQLSVEEVGLLGNLLTVQAAQDIRNGVYQAQTPTLVSLHDPVYLVVMDAITRLLQDQITAGMTAEQVLNAVTTALDANNATLATLATDAQPLTQMRTAVQNGAQQSVSDLQKQIQKLTDDNAALRQKVKEAQGIVDTSKENKKNDVAAKKISVDHSGILN